MMSVLFHDTWHPIKSLAPKARATTVASILYASPAWWGFAGEGNRLRLERLIARMPRRGYLPSDFPNIASLAEEADRRLGF